MVNQRNAENFSFLSWQTKKILKFLDLRNFAITNSFYEMHAVHHLWSNLKTCRLCTYCKAIFWKWIQRFFGFVDAFLFQQLLNGKYLSIWWFFTCYCLRMTTKIQNNSKFTKYQEMFVNLDCRWRRVCILWKLVLMAKFLKSQDFKTTFK